MISNLEEELWKEIQGYEGLYAVSNKGRVMNLKTGKVLNNKIDGAGYLAVGLKGKNYNVHRLMAQAFIPNPDNLPQVNHKNEIKHDNNVENLEWCSSSYNTNYSSHKQSCQVKQLDKNGNLIRIWNSFHQIEKETGYYQSAIIECCKGKRRSAYRYRWEYLDSSSQRVVNRPVTVYKGNEYIGTFANAIKASKALGLCDRSVYFCLQGRFNSNKGYSFKYAE